MAENTHSATADDYAQVARMLNGLLRTLDLHISSSMHISAKESKIENRRFM